MIYSDRDFDAIITINATVEYVSSANMDAPAI